MTSKLLGIGLAVALPGWVFFIVLGRTTVRRLDRNPETARRLGTEFMSGWRIFNVAYALVVPMAFFRIAENGPLAGLHADARAVRRHTGRFDYVLAHLFFWTFMTLALLLGVTTLLNRLGVID
ncbi:hypothetical protein [Alkalilimnicola sp. S0819]|uniref:hypothetical protein n=1 Tax=Alkalilimnicola sp. S0819 TaxID=2613922 RepID=UPI001262A88E|nr:hypothetical protein [Alkalilimnicola sp. S0819]KAB7627277.1 hypothetical protein F3N43_05015 [Alkalilimnicola sp. S0819]MPQ15990.1 hypothetical protein [Alkalilimnicola sp. S0819]